MKILVINAGSSSLKYQLINMDDKSVMAKGLCERIGIDGKNTFKPTGGTPVELTAPLKDHSDAIKSVIGALVNPKYGVISSMDEIDAVGHRVVHGGEMFSKSVIIDDEVMAAVEKCIPLAPLHNPANIIGINACKEVMPGVPQVGVFDTAFHQTMPEVEYMYGLPYELYENDKIRRYGFHGTSHNYVSGKAAEFLGKDIKDLKIICCHLGNGSSITAVKDGKSVATSMGLTPLDGVIMGTRCGSIDPAIITFLMGKGMTADEVDTLINKKSGVKGISGVSSDFRDLAAAAADGNERAALAVDMFSYDVKKYIGSYAAVMGGVDALVFTAGVGENDSDVRKKVTDGLEFLGIKIDEAKNNTRGTVDITAEGGKVKVLVIPTDEELMIALETQKLTSSEK
ncbi:MAG: acetate kinase [Clostridia bacterium]|nr:acetate kinase [Clostridia bacterium]